MAYLYTLIIKNTQLRCARPTKVAFNKDFYLENLLKNCE